jgi:mannose-6-phosphate isomerase-like protein (cupin superfamily)
MTVSGMQGQGGSRLVDVKVVKVQGTFVWHQHDETDELFLVTAGQLRIHLQDRDDVVLGAGELFVVTRGVRHCPVADTETHLVLLEPRDTFNTGDAERPGTAVAQGILGRHHATVSGVAVQQDAW